jgi:hypothetical protein
LSRKKLRTQKNVGSKGYCKDLEPMEGSRAGWIKILQGYEIFKEYGDWTFDTPWWI